MRYHNIPQPKSVTYDALTWQTPEIAYREFDQVTDGYVAPAFGYVIDDALYVDKWATNGDLMHWWESRLQAEYPEAETWRDAGNSHPIQFLLNGHGELTIQAPTYDHVDGEIVTRVAYLLDALAVPEDVTMTWLLDAGDTETGYVGDFNRFTHQ